MLHAGVKIAGGGQCRIRESKSQARRRGGRSCRIGRLENWLARMHEALPSLPDPALAFRAGNLVDPRYLRRDSSNALKIRSRRFLGPYYFSSTSVAMARQSVI